MFGVCVQEDFFTLVSYCTFRYFVSLEYQIEIKTLGDIDVLRKIFWCRYSAGLRVVFNNARHGRRLTSLTRHDQLCSSAATTGGCS